MTLPNFVVIGAGKAGTTSLYQYLREHPQVYMSPIKETNFLAYDPEQPGELVWGGPPRTGFAIVDLESYRALFAGVTEEIAIGEASPLYLDSLTAPGRIRDTLPDVRLIACLRQPADRAYSAYSMGPPPGQPQPSVREALRPDSEMVQQGFYHALLGRYFDLFDRERIEVILFDDLQARPLETMQGIYRFLGVDDRFEPDIDVRHNPSGRARSRLLHAVITSRALRSALEPFVPERLRRAALRIRNHNLQPVPPLPTDLRRELTDLYREDILRLQELIQRDLSHWLE